MSKSQKIRTVSIVISGSEGFVAHVTDVLRQFVSDAAVLGNRFEKDPCSTTFDFVDGKPN